VSLWYLSAGLRYTTAIAATAVIGLWIVVLHPLPGDWAKTSSSQSVDPLMFWLTVVLASLVGAIISGFISSMKQGDEKARIPLELAESTVTYARLSLAGLSSIAAFIFLSSGILKLGNSSFELALAIALVAGFSERLVLRTVESFWLSGILRGVKFLYYQLLMSTYRRSNILRSESSSAPDF
jgi:hypothetical protein